MTYVSRSFNLLADKYRDAGNKEKEDEYGEYYIEYSSSELEKMLGEASYLLGGIFTDFEDKETLSNIEALCWYQKSVNNGYNIANEMIKSLSTK